MKLNIHLKQDKEFIGSDCMMRWDFVRVLQSHFCVKRIEPSESCDFWVWHFPLYPGQVTSHLSRVVRSLGCVSHVDTKPLTAVLAPTLASDWSAAQMTASDWLMVGWDHSGSGGQVFLSQQFWPKMFSNEDGQLMHWFWNENRVVPHKSTWTWLLK